MVIPDRVAFTVFGKDIYWYGVLMAAGIIIAVLLAQSEEKRKKLPKDIVIDMCLWVIPFGVIGARLYYVLFELDRYLADPISILYIWEGGLAIYGAVIAGLITAFLFAKKRKLRFLTLADVIVPGLVLAQAIGRWGNFFNQEAFGLPVTADMLAKMPLLSYFPFSVAIEGAHTFDYAACTACVTTLTGAHLHLATFFYESLWCLLVFVFLWLRRKKFKHDGDAFVWYTLLYSFERMFVEGLRGDSLWLIKPSAPGLADGIRVSQALSALLFLAALTFLIVRTVREKKLGRLIWPAPLSAVEPEEGNAEEKPEEQNACQPDHQTENNQPDGRDESEENNRSDESNKSDDSDENDGNGKDEKANRNE